MADVGDIEIREYRGESDLKDIIELVSKDLSEPYSIFTYRFFINNWPQLCQVAKFKGKTVGVVVCKQEAVAGKMQGYIAMVAVDEMHRKKGIGSQLIAASVGAMEGCDEVVLEAEVSNRSALAMYEKLGFARTRRLPKYYLSGKDAFRLKLTF